MPRDIMLTTCNCGQRPGKVKRALKYFDSKCFYEHSTQNKLQNVIQSRPLHKFEKFLFKTATMYFKTIFVLKVVGKNILVVHNLVLTAIIHTVTQVQVKQEQTL